MKCVPIKASGHCPTCTAWHYRLHSIWDGENARYYCAECCPVCHPPPAVVPEPVHIEGPVETIEGEQLGMFGEGLK